MFYVGLDSESRVHTIKNLWGKHPNHFTKRMVTASK